MLLTASAGVLSDALHLTKLFSFFTSCLLFFTLSEQSLPSSSCELHACYCFSSSCHAFPSFLALTFWVWIRQLVMVMLCQQAGQPRGICREMLAHTLSIYLLLLLVFCCLFSPPSSNHTESRPCCIKCSQFQAGFLIAQKASHLVFRPRNAAMLTS